jgi:hypothetical protein
MIEEQKYLFDLNGYIVIENALGADELTLLNEIFDHQERPGDSVMMSYGGGSITGPGILAYGQPLVDLLDHPAILPVLRFRLGDCFRLDRLYAIAMSRGMAKGVMHSDYGASSPIAGSAPGEYYTFPLNEIHSGFTVVSWNLTDSGPGVGGFCCIPGSHKSNYRLPQQLADAGEESPHVIIPCAPAGSVTLFTEALTHSTSAWHGGHERRNLLYKYCVSQMAWGSGRVQAPDDCTLTPRQHRLLSEPAEPYRFFPSLFEEEPAS